jgi:hypothetical protein
MEKSLQEKLLNYHILLSNGVDTNDINKTLIERGFIAGDTAFCKKTNSRFFIKELLEELLVVVRTTNDDNGIVGEIFISDPELYYSKYEMRDFKINNIINKKEL